MKSPKQDELKGIRIFYIISLFPWIIVAGFSIALIERADLLVKIFLGLVWAYPLLIIIMYSIAKIFYKEKKYGKGNIAVFAPLWLPASVVFLESILKEISKIFS